MFPYAGVIIVCRAEWSSVSHTLQQPVWGFSEVDGGREEDSPPGTSPAETVSDCSRESAPSPSSGSCKYFVCVCVRVHVCVCVCV